MIRRNARTFLLGFALVAVFVVGIAMLTGDGSAQTEFPEEFMFEEEAPTPEEEPLSPEEEPPAPDALQVGTYDPDVAFRRHPVQQTLQMALRTAQSEMARAQQAGDQMLMQQVQQQYERTANMAIQEFQQDVTRVLPEVAAEAGVKVIATDVVYSADDVHISDITPQVIDAMLEGLPDAPAPPMTPEFPSPQY